MHNDPHSLGTTSNHNHTGHQPDKHNHQNHHHNHCRSGQHNHHHRRPSLSSSSSSSYDNGHHHPRHPRHLNSHETPGPGSPSRCTDLSSSLLEPFSPLERALITANGNLQRLLSAIFNSPIHLQILHNAISNGTCTRHLVLSRPPHASVEHVQGRVPLVLVSACLKCSKKRDLEFIRDSGLGQLFQTRRVIPEFTLLSLGRGAPPERLPMETELPPLPPLPPSPATKTGATAPNYWRLYRLSTDDIDARILEVFLF